MAVVYWIRAPHHTNIFTEGYVGVTSKTFAERFYQHKSDTKQGSQYPVHRAIRKYGDSTLAAVVIEGSEEYCYEMEKKLRPAPYIGYNVVIGGNQGPTGIKHTEEAKRKIGDWGRAQGRGPAHFNYGRKRTDEELLKMSLRSSGENNPNFGKTHSEDAVRLMSEVKLGENNPNFGNTNFLCAHSRKDVWLAAREIHDMYHSVGGCGERRLATLMGNGWTYATLAVITKQLRNGWNPEEDPKWLDFFAANNEGEHVNG